VRARSPPFLFLRGNNPKDAKIDSAQMARLSFGHFPFNRHYTIVPDVRHGEFAHGDDKLTTLAPPTMLPAERKSGLVCTENLGPNVMVMGPPRIARELMMPTLSFPKIPSGLDSHRKAESSHH